MTGKHVGWLALAIGLVLPAAAPAGFPWDCHNPAGCPRATYSPTHYWAPALNRLYWHCRGPEISVYPPAPPIPPCYQDARFPCPPVDPATLPRNLALVPVCPEPPVAPPLRLTRAAQRP